MPDRPRHSQDPELGDAIQLDSSETLEGDPNDDPLDRGYIPPDRPFGAEHTGTTAEEQLAGESLDERSAEEEPEDFRSAELDRAGRLVADTGESDQDLYAEDVGIGKLRAANAPAAERPADPMTGLIWRHSISVYKLSHDQSQDVPTDERPDCRRPADHPGSHPAAGNPP